MTVTRPLIAFAIPTLAALSLAACVPNRPAPVPSAMSQPTPAPVTASAPVVAPPAVNWIDVPATAGNWLYRTTASGSQALFGAPETEAEFMIECRRAAGQIALARIDEASGPVPMQILTQTQSRILTATPDGGDLPTVVAQVSARDPLFDAMAISKGRFAVEVSGMQTLYLPAWAEVTRVIEDCR